MMKKTIQIGKNSYILSSDDDYLESLGSTFEPHMVQLFEALIAPKDIVADIGANIGATAILFSSLAEEVYAFEPSPSTYKILTENLSHAKVKNVNSINQGLGNQPESLTITFAKNNRSGGFVSNKIQPQEGHATETINITTLDNYFDDKNRPPSFLKIDVEGFEQNVLKGGSKFIQAHKPTVVMELNHFCLNVLHRISVPDFLDFISGIFPYLFAIDTDNHSIVDMHLKDKAYYVMYQHVVCGRFPNMVASFTPETKENLMQISTQTLETT